VKIHAETDRFKIEQGVRQGDTISPKLFTTLIEYMFKMIELDNKCINVNEEKLNHLRVQDRAKWFMLREAYVQQWTRQAAI